MSYGVRNVLDAWSSGSSLSAVGRSALPVVKDDPARDE